MATIFFWSKADFHSCNVILWRHPYTWECKYRNYWYCRTKETTVAAAIVIRNISQDSDWGFALLRMPPLLVQKVQVKESSLFLLLLQDAAEKHFADSRRRNGRFLQPSPRCCSKSYFLLSISGMLKGRYQCAEKNHWIVGLPVRLILTNMWLLTGTGLMLQICTRY